MVQMRPTSLVTLSLYPSTSNRSMASTSGTSSVGSISFTALMALPSMISMAAGMTPDESTDTAAFPASSMRPNVAIKIDIVSGSG